MGNLFIYLIQSLICLVMFYLVFFAFLRKDTFFHVNRFYLVGAVVFSLLIPLFDFNLSINGLQSTYNNIIETIVITPVSNYLEGGGDFSVYNIIFIVYITGASLFFCRFLFQIFQLVFLIRKFGITREEGLKIVFTDRNYNSFSFFDIIFLSSGKINKSEIDKILAHEKIHVKQRHSIDILILEILIIVQWFNPIVWLYRFSIKGVHEYLADEGVVLQGYNKKSYQELLLSQAMGIQVNDLTNSFNQSLIKKRIIMMTKLRSKTKARFKILAIVPVLALLLMAFSGSQSAIILKTDILKKSSLTEINTGNSNEDINKLDIQDPQKKKQKKEKKLNKKQLEKKKKAEYIKLEKMSDAEKIKLEDQKKAEYIKIQNMSEADRKKLEQKKKAEYIKIQTMSDADRKKLEQKKKAEYIKIQNMSEADRKKLEQKKKAEYIKIQNMSDADRKKLEQKKKAEYVKIQKMSEADKKKLEKKKKIK